MKTITITKKRYKELLASEHELNALHEGGVDNWNWYWDSYNIYIQNYANKHPDFLEMFKEPGETDEDVIEDMTFDTIAEYELKK